MISGGCYGACSVALSGKATRPARPRHRPKAISLLLAAALKPFRRVKFSPSIRAGDGPEKILERHLPLRRQRHEMDETIARLPLLRDYGLPRDEVHVWRIILDWPAERVNAMNAVLSLDEQQKADRFHFEQDRTRHVVGRGVLRSILARCMKTEAERLRFEYNKFGKPRLADGPTQPLQFNVSHSGDLVLIALTIERAVGIDVERTRNDLEVERIAASYFSLHERRTLHSLPAHQRRDAFFDCWTRKEAYIKAIGDGLSLPLDQFDVCFLPGQEPRLLATRPDPAEAGRWVFRALDLGPDYKAAVAVEGAGWQLRTWEWPATDG
jgi:4'-phosphopantetheinyl transferase